MDWVSVALIVMALAATAAVYPLLPEIVPRHWNIYGQVDAWSPRASVFGMIGVTALLFALFRTRWTLADETTWRVTHRVGGYVTMAGGAGLAALALVLREPWIFVAPLGLLGLLMLAAVPCSWAVYRSRSR